MVSGAKRSRQAALRRLLFALALVAYCLCSLRYILATSVVEEGQRWFVLWDDAMISMQYARNLAYGHGLVWNVGGEPVQGFTNLGITLFMAFLHGLAIPLPYVSLAFQLVNLVVLVGILFGIHRLARLVFPQKPQIADGAAILTGLYGPLAIWGLQGADFPIQAAIAIGALCLLLEAHKEGRPPPLSVFVVLAVGIVIREDFALVFGTVWLWSVCFAFPNWRSALPSALLGLGVVVVLLLFSQWYFGDPLPNTYYLKSGGHPRLEMVINGFRQLMIFYSGFKVAVLVLFVAYTIPLLLRDADRSLLLLVLLIAGQFAYFVWIGGDWAIDHMSRYLMVAMPLFILLLVGGTWDFLLIRARTAGSALGGGRLMLFWAQVALFVWLLNPPASFSEWHLATEEPRYRKENALNLHMAYGLCAYTAPDTTVGIFWAGLTPYVCSRDYLDLLGRTDRHIAKKRMTSFEGGPGHAKWDWDYVFGERKPDVLATFIPEIQARSDFDGDYCAARMPRPRLIIPVRKDALDKILDRDRRLCGVRDYDRCIPCEL